MLDTVGNLVTKRFFNNPIFIVGGGRSGTIALLKAMGNHPEILITPSEDPFITDVGGMMYGLEYADEREKQYYLRTLRISHDHIHKSLRQLCLESALGPNYGLKYLLKAALKQRINPFSRRCWCTKTFPNERVAMGLMRLYPGAKFIYILRNGLNVVHSRTKFPEFRELEFEEQCHTWANGVNRFGYLVELPEATMVRQEELADDPEAVFRRIFNHIGIVYHPGPATFARTTHVHPLAEEKTAQGVDVKRALQERPPIYEDWTHAQKDIFKRICGDTMASAGYQVPF
jgi:hypothetical protein